VTDLLADRWQQIERLYNGALDRSPTEREAFLAQACGDDEELRQEVRTLLGYERVADQYALTGVTVGVRVFQDVEQVATLDVEDDVLEPYAALRPELRVLRVVPVEVLHSDQRSTTCAHKAHTGTDYGVPSGVPKPGPRIITRQPTPTKLPKKTGLKSSISGPFCDFWQPY
jgi:hypothetical protein